MVYDNDGNGALLEMLPPGPLRVLDVGCGAGQNARLLRVRGCSVVGVTLSHEEAEIAARWCDEVVVGNVESDDLGLVSAQFDVLLLSHVVEHFCWPTATLCRLAPLLKPGGTLVIAVPNMGFWRVRWRILRGDWSRDDAGFFDRTHRQFWTVRTASSILDGTPFVLGSLRPSSAAVPLWLLRRLGSVAKRIDATVGKLIPNLVCMQVCLTAHYPATN